MNNEATGGRCIALFPGAFRPPHINHYSTVVELASRPDVDEVVVIITNRCRSVPGTSKVLDVDVALSIWSIYLKDFANVRVEVAPKGAVKHALSYFDRVETGDTLLFCVGESDLCDGDGRFKKVDAASKHSGVKASVIPGSGNVFPVRATQLRAMLTGGSTERARFIATLPPHLTPAQRASVWSACQQGMMEMRDIVMQKVRALVQRHVGEISDIGVAKSDKPDEVFRVQLKDGRCIFVKYAHDTVKAARVEDPNGPKPRKRLKAERGVIKWLRAHTFGGIELPQVVCFDKEAKALMLSEVCPGGRHLQDDLEQGVFDQAIARKASRFLAQCHRALGPDEPLWDDDEADLNHWRTMLALRTTDIKANDISAQSRQDLRDLMLASDAARSERFVNLDFAPKNILIANDTIGIIDFELSSSVGDLAYDLGFFLGHYILWGFCTSSSHHCQQAIREALIAYRQEIGVLWASMRSRVVAFAGASILHALSNDSRISVGGSANQLAVTATSLLSKGLRSAESTDQILFNAVVG